MEDGARGRCGRRESWLREPGRGSWAARREIKRSRPAWVALGWVSGRNWAAPGKRGREVEWAEKVSRLCHWAGLVFGIGLETVFGFSSFLFLSSFSNKLKPNEFKSEFEFTQALKQLKQCSSMMQQRN